MSDHQGTMTDPARPASVRSDLLLRLGLEATADDQQVAGTHDRIVAYLDAAPDEISGWTERRRHEVDRIFALLTGPESALEARAGRTGPHGPAAARAHRGATNRTLLGVVAALVAVGVVLGVYWTGRPAVPATSTPVAQTGAGQTAPPPLDRARLAQLTAKVKADPKDVVSLQSIADLHFTANGWAEARAAAQRVLDVDPENEQGLVTLGAAAFNGGDPAAAEQAWQTGVRLHPGNAELHYDLGFLYMTTGRTAQMRSEWAKVVELAPNSEIAKAVQSQVGPVTTPSGTPAG
ncbi:tetratricopeptide repeat protein [Intrasporangium sp.]|uniref:tetratricopeptide repeat protein n=1 Tax=Intrasporangium sp. TaxID=1925024 RepID=UPI00322150C0